MSKKTHTPPAPFVNQWPVWLTSLWAAVVAGIAGFINAHSFTRVEAYQVPVTHMTGTASKVALSLGSGSFGRTFAILVSVGVGFVLGAAVSGMIVGTRVLKPGRRYGIVWAVEGGMLLAAEALFVADLPWAATFMMAAACGLQNAMASSYLGLVLRTTHLTGVLTDLGIWLGHFLKREQVPWPKVCILSSILAGFLGGGVLAALWHTEVESSPLLYIGVALLVFGLGYYIHRVRVRRRMQSVPAAIADE